MSDDEWYEDARKFNVAFKESVAEVQSWITDEPWIIDGIYGHVPMDCAGGYQFDMWRSTPANWRAGTDAETAARRLGDWLWEQGWSVKLHTYGEGIDNVVITASNNEKHVADLYVNFLLGSHRDIVSLEATSTCRPGDPNELMDILDPGWLTETEDPVMPETEVPGTPPIFGFNEDGTPRST
ncbi:hypothetical protein ACFUTX_04250 [Microbacterium sp. NPDC057407]|uniref:hypothetical protein n=1 Tax=Microbacterium sp. NPDC057407 TaxID=3346120 RepID=UPI00366A9E5C